MTAPGRLAVSLVPPTFAALDRAVAEVAAEGHADVIELRLDHLAAAIAADPGPLAHVIACAGVPFIAAIHGAEGFGSFRGTARERFAALGAAVDAGATWVDVDESLAPEFERPEGARLILSSHAVPPEPAALDAAAGRLVSLVDPGRGDLVKLVPACGSAAEGFAVLDWLAGRPLGTTVAFGSGEAASFTRLLAPAFGSALTYGAWGAGERQGLQPAAPGQWEAATMKRIWAGGMPGPDTAIAAVCGVPIAHSLSPVVHGAAARELGVNGLLVPVAPGSLEDLWRWPRVRERLAGLSVTAPFKGDAAALDPLACPSGAANTLVRGDEGWRAFNTDEDGVMAALSAAGASPVGALAVIVGAGGAARAAAAALVREGAEVVLLGRSGERAAALAQDLQGRLGAAVRGLALDADEALELRPAIVVHATPVGTGDPKRSAPVPDEFLGPGVVVLDAVYAPRNTALLERAVSRGARPARGIDWFLEQAWGQHRLIFGGAIEGLFGPDGPPPEGERRARLAMGQAVSPDPPPAERRPVLALVGLRGSGKSTVGARVAQDTGALYVDLDHEIARRAGAPGAGEVFAARGERAFRVLEARALREVLEAATAPTVLSCGGGVVEGTLARALLRGRTHCLWLDGSPEVCRARVLDDRDTLRPPLLDGDDPGDEFEVLRRRRLPLYRDVAQLTADADRPVAAVAADVAALWLRSRDVTVP